MECFSCYVSSFEGEGKGDKFSTRVSCGLIIQCTSRKGGNTTSGDDCDFHRPSWWHGEQSFERRVTTTVDTAPT